MFRKLFLVSIFTFVLAFGYFIYYDSNYKKTHAYTFKYSEEVLSAYQDIDSPLYITGIERNFINGKIITLGNNEHKYVMSYLVNYKGEIQKITINPRVLDLDQSYTVEVIEVKKK